MSVAADLFEEHRGHLTGLAYRMLGEMAAAEDAVQEAWLRWQQADKSGVENPRAFLSTVTIRLALDALRSARARRETYVGPWLPEPLLPDDVRAFAPAPDAQAELASDLSLALLHVLERLSPEERAAFILHDAFDCDYAVIAAMLERSEPACRKLVSRARQHVRQERPRYPASAEAHRLLLARFLEASATADETALRALLAPEAIAFTDGGGRVAAALLPVYGAGKVARLIGGLSRKFLDRERAQFVAVELSGLPALAMQIDGQLDLVLQLVCEADSIVRVLMIRNPSKLSRLQAAISDE